VSFVASIVQSDYVQYVYTILHWLIICNMSWYVMVCYDMILSIVDSGLALIRLTCIDCFLVRFPGGHFSLLGCTFSGFLFKNLLNILEHSAWPSGIGHLLIKSYQCLQLQDVLQCFTMFYTFIFQLWLWGCLWVFVRWLLRRCHWKCCELSEGRCFHP
jgi:hypothetical protein